MQRGYDEGQIATVKGLAGRRHYTLNAWYNEGKLRTLCNRGISPNYRDLSSPVECTTCKNVLMKLKGEYDW